MNENMLALDGLRVIECGTGVSSAYAGKLLADLGADVWKLEPPSGDPLRRTGPFPNHEESVDGSGLFHYLNSNKEGMIWDLSKGLENSALQDVLAEADVLVHDLAPGSLGLEVLEAAEVLERNPRLILTDISHFGRRGRYAEYQGVDLISLCAGGLTYVCGTQPPDPKQPPLKPFGTQAEFQAGTVAAVATMGALFSTLGGGDGQTVEVSVRASIASIIGAAIPWYTYSGQVATRLGRRSTAPWAFLDCSDGPILAFCVEEEEWQRLLAILGSPEWGDWPVFADRLSRGTNWDALRPLLQAEFEKWTVHDLYRAAQDQKVPLAPVSSMQDLLESPQLEYRRYFAPMGLPVTPAVMPGRPYTLSRTPWSVRRPARSLASLQLQDGPQWSPRAPSSLLPAPGTPELPLGHIRVLDLSRVWAGPYCTRFLGALGADVIKVESSRRLDTTRRAPPFADGEMGVNRSGAFHQHNQGKRSIAIDLTTDSGRQLVRQLALASDVVVENFAPGTMRRWGLDYDDLKGGNERLIYVSLSAYGADGPESQFISYGPALEPLSGLSVLSGHPGQGPADMGLSYADPNAGVHAAFAVLAALWSRQNTGQGQRIDVSLLETAIAVVPEAIISQSMNGSQPPRQGNRDGAMSPHGIFPCVEDDTWLGLAIRTDEEFQRFCSAIGSAQLGDDPRFVTFAQRKANEDQLEALVTDWTAKHTAFDATSILQGSGVPAFPCLTARELVEDPDLADQGYFVKFDHPEVGSRVLPGIPWIAKGAQIRGPAPLLGADTAEVLSEVLGLSQEAIEALRSQTILS